jgi:hypothetical protein
LIALLQFAFQLGGAVSLCISQALFLSSLTVNIMMDLPDVPVGVVIDAGAYGLPSLAPSPAELHALRVAYRCAVRNVFIFLLVAAGLALFVSFGFEHKNVRTVEEERKKVNSDDIELESIT